MIKKMLVLAAIAVAGYLAYSKVTEAQDERDLWNEATAAPDLR
ncbi:MAG: DLW-39 family protein [Candidatus Nanopelagicales bacterium]|nr:DLW-39 family protein [Candidatus Nanopelagicales bacterium]